MPFIITLSVQQWIVRTVRDEIHIFDKANCILTHYAVDLSEYIYIYIYVYICIDFLSFLLLSLPSFFSFYFNMGPGTSSFVKKKEPKTQKTK